MERPECQLTRWQNKQLEMQIKQIWITMLAQKQKRLKTSAKPLARDLVFQLIFLDDFEWNLRKVYTERFSCSFKTCCTLKFYSIRQINRLCCQFCFRFQVRKCRMLSGKMSLKGPDATNASKHVRENVQKMHAISRFLRALNIFPFRKES